MRTTLLTFCLLLLSACIAVEQRSGYVFNESAIAQVKVGESTRKEVMQLMGTPTTRSEFQVERWHYVGNKAEVISVLTPEVQEQQVVSVEFDEAGLVSAVERKNLQDSRKIDMVGRTTKTEGSDFTILQQVIGNFGKFNKEKDASAATGK